MTSELKIAVAFFGITRSLRHTIGSVNEKLLEPARSHRNTVVCCHFFHQKHIDNARTSERGALDTSEYKLLSPDRAEFSEPQKILADIGFEEIKTFGDHWCDDFKTLSNLLHQLYSLKRVTRLVREEGADVVAFCRPDLMYHDSFGPALDRALAVSKPSVFLPRWQRHKGGFNDRFAIASGKEAIEAYGGRLDHALSFCRKLSLELHSERLIRFAMSNSLVSIEKLSVRASRVRNDGRMVDEDFSERSWKMLRNAIRFQRLLAR